MWAIKGPTVEFGGISKGGSQCVLGIREGAWAVGGGHHVAQSQWFCFLPFRRGLSFSIFLACDSLILLVINNLGVGFGLFVDTIFLALETRQG